MLIVKAKVTQSCPTLCDPMDYAIHGILRARILKWIAFPFSRGFSRSRDRAQVSHIAGSLFTSWTTVYNKPCTVCSFLTTFPPLLGHCLSIHNENLSSFLNTSCFWLHFLHFALYFFCLWDPKLILFRFYFKCCFLRKIFFGLPDEVRLLTQNFSFTWLWLLF